MGSDMEGEGREDRGTGEGSKIEKGRTGREEVGREVGKR
jgi:hypothetical protein